MAKQTIVKRPYLKPGRLADVLALIQVLALDRYTTRSESGIRKELQGPPSSSTEWFVLASEHREFFRVNSESESGLSLVGRYVLPHETDEYREPLTADFVSVLLTTAIDLHDRQVSDAEAWKTWMPVWSSVISAIVSAVVALAVHHYLPK